MPSVYSVGIFLMYAFVIAFGLKHNNHGEYFSALGHRLKALYPDYLCEWEMRQTLLPECEGGWVALHPRPSESPPLMQHCLYDELAVFVYGTIIGCHDTAAAVRDAFRAGGERQVRLLNGSFSAVIVDRQKRRAVACCDLVGRLSLRYFTIDGGLWLSATDAALVATKRCPVDWNMTTAASNISLFWPVGGHSLLKAIRPNISGQFLYWCHDGVIEQEDFPLDLSQRLNPNDKKSIAGQLNKIADIITQTVAAGVQGHDHVRVSLTAGSDSRAIFAILCHIVPRDQIEAVTTGDSNSLDVRIAARLCKRAGVRHTIKPRKSNHPLSERSMDNALLQIHYTNGVRDGISALPWAAKWPPAVETPKFGGGHGEIYTGAYHKYFGLTEAIPDSIESILKVLLGTRFNRLRKLPFNEPEFSNGVVIQLQQRLTQFSRYSSSGYDWLDLLYLLDRTSFCVAADVRIPWVLSRLPYVTPAAVREAYRLPSPIAHHCYIQAHLVGKYLPESRGLPINGGHLMSLEGGGGKAMARQAMKLWGHFKMKLRRAKARKQRDRSSGIVTLAPHPETYDLVHETLLESRSLSTQLLKRPDLENMLGDYRSRGGNSNIIGRLFAIELYRYMVEKARM